MPERKEDKRGQITPERKEDTRDLEHLVIEYNATARITYELAQQLQKYLPISSLRELAEKVEHIEIEKQRMPVKAFEKHISEDLFPIENVDELVRKLSGGVRTALALTQDPSFPIRNPVSREILASVRMEPGSQAAIPVAFSAINKQSKQLNKGGS